MKIYVLEISLAKSESSNFWHLKSTKALKGSLFGANTAALSAPSKHERNCDYLLIKTTTSSFSENEKSKFSPR
jgi:hypothetical protein